MNAFNTVHAFGDTGGHYGALLDSLVEIGLDVESFKLPKDAIILHMGDLVHRGPHSDSVVSLVATIMDSNPGQWIQIMGNHELMHFDQSDFYHCNCADYTQFTLLEWLQTGKMKVAHAFPEVLPQKWTEGNRPVHQEEIITDFLAVHGGLTSGFWKILGQPSTVTEASEAINGLSLRKVRRAGVMLLGESQWNAGPIWAAGGQEVFPSWVNSPVAMPFSQIVGHSAVFNYSRNNWPAYSPQILRENSKVLSKRNMTMGFVQSKAILFTDPGFGPRKPEAPQPYISFQTPSR